MAVFVLVHGSGTGGWVWRRVRPLLQRDGHEVHTPTLTGLGERAHLARRDIGLATHIDDIVGVIDAEELTDVVLAAQGYASLIARGVADRRPGRIRRLVYIDGVVVGNGQSLLDVMPAELREQLQRLVLAGDGWRVPPTPHGSFGPHEPDGCDLVECARLMSRRHPLPLTCFTEPLVLRRVHEVPAQSYIHCCDKGDDEPDPARAIVTQLRTLGWDIHELRTGHFCMLTMPHATAQLLEKLAAQ